MSTSSYPHDYKITIDKTNIVKINHASHHSSCIKIIGMASTAVIEFLCLISIKGPRFCFQAAFREVA